MGKRDKSRVSWNRRWEPAPDGQEASGGQGIVTKVHKIIDGHSDEEALVGALKVRKGTKDKALQRFRREIEILEQLKAVKNVPQLLDCDERDSRWYIAEWIEGNEASPIEVRDPGLRLDRAILLCLRLARVVEECHQEGVIHRDIKPANVMVTQDEEVWLVDFGVSWLDDADTVTSTDESIGNYLLRLPELNPNSKRKSHPGSDVAFLGAMLLYWLSGELAIQLRDEEKVLPHRRYEWEGIEDLEAWPRARHAMDRAFRWEADKRPTVTQFIDILEGRGSSGPDSGDPQSALKERLERSAPIFDEVDDRKRAEDAAGRMVIEVLAPAFQSGVLSANIWTLDAQTDGGWQSAYQIQVSLADRVASSVIQDLFFLLRNSGGTARAVIADSQGELLLDILAETGDLEALLEDLGVGIDAVVRVVAARFIEQLP